jgi:DNA-binding transcriptional ArsR family regulator
MIHSQFNPAMMPAQLLEQVLVQRHDIAAGLVEDFRESAEVNGSRHHALIVGPRGIGKSHLIAVVLNRLKADEALREKLAIAWLPEDEWAISNFNDFLREILRALGGDVTRLHRVPPDEFEHRAWDFIRQQIGDRRLLVVVENLDEILDNFGAKGQQKWRALVQNTGIWAILAGSPSLSTDFTCYDAPFYGFFSVRNLEGLTSGEAIEFMRKMAESQGNPAMAEKLATPDGRARVRCVYHLAGGNPRVFVTFYQMLADGIDGDLVTPVLKLVDAMTPYYQSQMRTLSPQQRKIVDFLCRNQEPVNVKAISEACGMSQQSSSSQLGHLLDRRFVSVERSGRESQYELAEPLMRICVECKRHDAGLLPLVVEFLRLWYTEEELSGDEEHFHAARSQIFDLDTAERILRVLGPMLTELVPGGIEWQQVFSRVFPPSLIRRYLKNSPAAAAVAAMSASE